MITSIIPIILMNLFSYYNTTGIVRDNITEMTEYNLEQTQSSVNTNVESYRDLLYLWGPWYNGKTVDYRFDYP